MGTYHCGRWTFYYRNYWKRLFNEDPYVFFPVFRLEFYRDRMYKGFEGSFVILGFEFRINLDYGSAN